MQKLIFNRNVKGNRQEYVFSIGEHNLSPSNLLVRKIFYFLLDEYREVMTELSVEYSDYELADKVGIERAREILRILGAERAQVQENRKNGFVVSRSFTTAVTSEQLEYFYSLWDLRELPRYQFYQDNDLLLDVYFGEKILFYSKIKEDLNFFARLENHKIPYEIKD
ncbi:MAG: hypothetical protein H0Z33_05330 [Bacillaceae bacterium]|nr:hypothetical protein [Bacillaceae bacterium]